MFGVLYFVIQPFPSVLDKRISKDSCDRCHLLVPKFLFRMFVK